MAICVSDALPAKRFPIVLRCETMRQRERGEAWRTSLSMIMCAARAAVAKRMARCTRSQRLRSPPIPSARIRERNGLDPKLVDDVVLGCVDPVGEAGGDIARAAALRCRLRHHRARRANQSLLCIRSRCDQFRCKPNHRRSTTDGPCRRY